MRRPTKKVIFLLGLVSIKLVLSTILIQSSYFYFICWRQAVLSTQTTIVVCVLSTQTTIVVCVSICNMTQRDYFVN
jgi:hypothetical protein